MIEAATELQIAEVWAQRWDLPIVSVDRRFLPHEVEGLAWKADDGQVKGLVTWTAGPPAEIVSLDALEEGQGIGSALLRAAEETLRQRGVDSVRIVTTNDNLRALFLYLRRGYRLKCVHLDAMERVRQAKPNVATIGQDGIPLRDMLELEKELVTS